MPPNISWNVLTIARRAGATYRCGSTTTFLQRAPSQCFRPSSKAFSPRLASTKSANKVGKKPVRIAHHGAPKAASYPSVNGTGMGRMIQGRWNPVAKKLAERPSTTLLYESPSKSLYVLGCYGLGVFCLAWTTINGYNLLINPMEGVEISRFVKGAYGSVCVVMLVFGGIAISRTFRIVRSITAVPYVLRDGQQSLRLQVEVGALRARPILAELEDISISGRLHKEQIRKTAFEEAALSRDRWRKDKERILTLPFRQVGRGFTSLRKAVFGDGWLHVKIKGKPYTYKMDSRPAWAMEEGKTLDTLIKQNL